MYYVVETRPPAALVLPAGGNASSSITAEGTVEPAQNPDLSFESGGTVAHVYVAVGAGVARNQTLATLDASALVAQRAQAAATLKSQQAALAQMQAPARSVDVSAKQTAVSQAELALNNLYANVADTLNDAYGKTSGAVHQGSDTLFNNPDSTNATLIFSSSNSQKANNLLNARVAVNTDLDLWESQVQALSSDPGTLDAAIVSGLAHLSVARMYANAVNDTLPDAIATNTFPQASINAAIITAGAMRDAIAARITALQALAQQISSAKLAVTAAQDALNQTLAGATQEQINAEQAQVEAAQAAVSAIDAQIAKTIISAPFSGTVSSVRIKPGDTELANVPAISLTARQRLADYRLLLRARRAEHLDHHESGRDAGRLRQHAPFPRERDIDRPLAYRTKRRARLSRDASIRHDRSGYHCRHDGEHHYYTFELRP